jgi:hypothetical protein
MKWYLVNPCGQDGAWSPGLAPFNRGCKPFPYKPDRHRKWGLAPAERRNHVVVDFLRLLFR